MTTPNQYREIDDRVYDTDSSKVKIPFRSDNKARNKFTEGTTGQQYVILKTVDTNDKSNSQGYTQNGFQGMAVAPCDENGVPQKDKVIVAFAGTNKEDGKDLNTDANNVFFGSKEFKQRTGLNSGVRGDSQFTSAEQFYNEVAKMPDVNVVSLTGHSLGGALAQKVAAENELPAVTFSTAGVGLQLTDKEKNGLMEKEKT
ncbi:hypothetical protein OGZ37_13030 [Lactococcus lactis]|uniref:lipase family protein n=1 Tax=Lactococcus lactis TaxID=1358 RepID=UPI0024187FCD|nr:hypothetical protein [Lactococcus lactis]MDG4967481.1 hypothetical protein [Lactococcus lactis]